MRVRPVPASKVVEIKTPHPLGLFVFNFDFFFPKASTGPRLVDGQGYNPPPPVASAISIIAIPFRTLTRCVPHAGGEGFRSEGHRRGVPAQSARPFPCPQRS